MELLKDIELVALVSEPKQQTIVEGLKMPKDPYDKCSPVQPSSLDMHIGMIFVPGNQEDVPLGQLNVKKEHSLEPGGTTVVMTLEKLKLPNDIAGIGFPSVPVSSKGILMTNPGHVDPGYEGPMRFTLINMGKNHYPLKQGDIIITMLFFRLSSPVHRGWMERNINTLPMPSLADVNCLTRDFVNVSERATNIATGIIVKTGIWVALAVAIVTVGFPYVTSIRTPEWKKPLDKVKVEIADLQRKIDGVNLNARLEKVESLSPEIERLRKEVERLKAEPVSGRMPLPATSSANGSQSGVSGFGGKP